MQNLRCISHIYIVIVIIYKNDSSFHRRIKISIGVWMRIAEIGREGKEQALERETEDEAQNGVAAEPLRVAGYVLTQGS
ncbi:arginine deiminase [Sesbania bispinosa]|nr:arginine deiminase [Sesbania bispinosa]